MTNQEIYRAAIHIMANAESNGIIQKDLAYEFAKYVIAVHSATASPQLDEIQDVIEAL